MGHGKLFPRRWVPGSVCVICGEKIYCYQRFNFDHLIPMSKGGRRGKSNKYLSHVICNSVKSDQHPFGLRTAEEREQVRHMVREETWLALIRAWNGLGD